MLTGPVHKLIRLANSSIYTAVSVSDVAWIERFVWYPRMGSNGALYAYTLLSGNPVEMQRFILASTDHRLRPKHKCNSCRYTIKSDHRNGVTLDNRRCNLRVLSTYDNNDNETNKTLTQ